LLWCKLLLMLFFAWHAASQLLVAFSASLQCALVGAYCWRSLLAAGVRLVVEVRRGFSPQLVLNQLYKSTRLQLRFSTNMVSLQLSTTTAWSPHF
jgi:hypothetical protein